MEEREKMFEKRDEKRELNWTLFKFFYEILIQMATCDGYKQMLVYLIDSVTR